MRRSRRATLNLKSNHLQNKRRLLGRTRKNKTRRKEVNLKLINRWKSKPFLSHKINPPLNLKSNKYIKFLKSTPKLKIRIKLRAEANRSK
jgi:hypothetical protein